MFVLLFLNFWLFLYLEDIEMRPPSQISKVKNPAISVLSKIVPFHLFLFIVKILNSASAIAQNEFERSARSWYRSASKTSIEQRSNKRSLMSIVVSRFISSWLYSSNLFTPWPNVISPKKGFLGIEKYIYIFRFFFHFLFYLSCLSVHHEHLTTEMHILTVEILKFLAFEPHWCRILSDSWFYEFFIRLDFFKYL